MLRIYAEHECLTIYVGAVENLAAAAALVEEYEAKDLWPESATPTAYNAQGKAWMDADLGDEWTEVEGTTSVPEPDYYSLEEWANTRIF